MAAGSPPRSLPGGWRAPGEYSLSLGARDLTITPRPLGTACVAGVCLCSHSRVHRRFVQSPESGLGQPHLTTPRGDRGSRPALHVPSSALISLSGRWPQQPPKRIPAVEVRHKPAPWLAGTSAVDTTNPGLASCMAPPHPICPHLHLSDPGLCEGPSFLRTSVPMSPPSEVRSGLVPSLTLPSPACSSASTLAVTTLGPPVDFTCLYRLRFVSPRAT